MNKLTLSDVIDAANASSVRLVDQAVAVAVFDGVATALDHIELAGNEIASDLDARFGNVVFPVGSEAEIKRAVTEAIERRISAYRASGLWSAGTA